MSDSEISLAGQTALVTGASSGIGAATARVLAAAGAVVGANYRSDRDGAARVVADIEAAGGRAVALQGDVADEDAVAEIYDRFVEAAGRLDILVANAGVQTDVATHALSLADWRKVIDVNLTGGFLCARAALRQFRDQDPSRVSRARGKIVAVTSIHQHVPWAAHANYAASKGGMAMMMKSLAQEVAADGIRVNAVAPGPTRTDINRAAREDPEGESAMRKLVPYGRLGEAEDIGRAVRWLASDDADFVTGATLVVDGGASLYPAFAPHT
jgi:glucose 1-dehydrogenase